MFVSGIPDDMTNADRSLKQIQHQFAVWAAGTAGRASPKCRFTVSHAGEILEALGFGPGYGKPDKLPLPHRFDAKHREWREKAVKEARKRGIKMSHGVAAKLINVYLKSRFICGGHADHPRVAALHPPIDSILLQALAKANYASLGPTWRLLARKRWSAFDSDTYESAIGVLKAGGIPWMAERYWAI
jgi:hypothetical protein